MSLVLFAAVPFVYGQSSGFNFSVGFGNPLLKTTWTETSYVIPFGFAFQHDFDRHFGVGLDYFLRGDGYSGIASSDWIYSAKYFVTDNDATSFYVGSFFGLQHFKGKPVEHSGTNGSLTRSETSVSKAQFPIGIRAGVRGGLRGYFGEVFAQVGYAIGNGTLYTTSDGVRMATAPVYFSMGFSFLGLGWDQRSKK